MTPKATIKALAEHLGISLEEVEKRIATFLEANKAHKWSKSAILKNIGQELEKLKGGELK
jgi:hypothetical protein